MMKLSQLRRFPCNSLGKPIIADWPNRATTDIAVLCSWPHGPKIGVPTGPQNGLAVLDIDPRHGGHLWLAAHELPPTRMHETPRGGMHFIFKWSGQRNSAGRIAPGVDVRGAGGFFVWHPASGFSVRNPDLLADWPEWLVAPVLSETPTVVPSEGDGTRLTVKPRSRERAFAITSLNNAMRELGRVEQGRNDRLNILAYKMGRQVARGWMLTAEVYECLEIAARESGLVRDDGLEKCRATIKSGLKGGMQVPYPDLQPLAKHTVGVSKERPPNPTK